jgi:hypothetical protein
MGMNPRLEEKETSLRSRLIAIGAVVVLAALVIFLLTSLSRQVDRERTIRERLQQLLRDEDVVELEVAVGNPLRVTATVLSSENITPETVAALEARIGEELGRTVDLELIVLPVVRSP